MSRFKRFGAALVLSSVMATGMATVFSTSVQASDGPIPVSAICSFIERLETAVAGLPEGRLRTYLEAQLDALEAKYSCVS
jgi:hypothetical protein